MPSFDVVLCTQVLEHCDDPAQAVRELRRVTAPGGRVLASTHGVQVYHPSPEDYWRWTHAGLRRLFTEHASWESVEVRAGGGNRIVSRDAARRVHRDRVPPRTLPQLAGGPVWLFNRAADALDRRVELAARASSGLPDGELPRRRDRRCLMRLFRRNVLGTSTRSMRRRSSLGSSSRRSCSTRSATTAFGIWAFIGSLTIYLSVLDLGVGPSIIRFAAEARGRQSPEETNDVASNGLMLYATDRACHAADRCRRWRGSFPMLITTPDDLVWPARIATLFSSSSRSPPASRSASSTTCSWRSSASTC